jgi:hypothetical protein
MRAVDRWKLIEDELGDDWEEARLTFAVESASSVGAAAAVLAPLGPGRSGHELRFQVTRAGAGPERLRNLLRRLDRKRIWGTLSLVDARSRAEPEEPTTAGPARPSRSLAEGWDRAVTELPAGWRDLLCELELDSTDYLPQAALVGAPLNPTRVPGKNALRFRVSRGGGYGAPPGMARRCLERMDEARITGRVRVLHALSDTDNAVTQGPVWRVAGRSV